MTSINQPPSDTKTSTRAITKEEMYERLAFWPEFMPLFGEFKFAPHGVTSLTVPEFHKKNIINIANTTAVEDYQYSPFQGRTDLRESVLNNFPESKLFTEAGIGLTIDNIMIASGAVGGINACIDDLCGPDDEVILFEPIYPFHLSMVLSKNLTLRTVRMNYNPQINSFEIDYEALKRTLTPKSRVLIICNPNNPACNVYTKEEYQKISEIIHDFPRLMVIEDAAYFLYYKDGHKPIPYAVVNPHDFDRAITFYSGGKMYNVTGLRIGIGIGPKGIPSKMIRTFILESQMTASMEQLLIRDDILSANEKNEDGLDFYEETRRDVVKRGNLIAEELKDYGMKAVQDDGTYYIVLDIEALRGTVDEKYYYKLDNPEVKTPELDKAFCRMLFLEKKVGLFPMSQLMFKENIPDNLLRIPKNRNDKDLWLMINSCKELLKKLNPIGVTDL